MCAAIEIHGKTLRPGKLVAAWRNDGPGFFPWAGFARRERLGWWKQQGGELVDVPAHRFAERSDRDRKLRWDEVPAGAVVRGLLEPNGGKPLLKIVTRAATPEEFARYEHDRMPLIEPPLISAEPIETPEAEPPAQRELF
jgi:hypothetical protein